MASLSNSTDVYVDKLYIDFGEVGVVDLAETVAAKAEKAETYSISVMDMILDDKIDDTEFVAVVSRIDSNIDEKANSTDVYTKAEINASALSTTSALASKADKVDTYKKSDTYSKSEVDTTFANLVNSAPAALNQLSELANALANDANYATTVQNQLALKAPLANPTFTDATVGGNLTVTGTLNTTSFFQSNRILLYVSFQVSSQLMLGTFLRLT